MFSSIEELQERLADCQYIVDRSVATTVFLALKLEKPIFVEGPAGVGKTELANSLARATGSTLIRLQCYAGLDESQALYEWDYPRQLLRLHIDALQNRSWDTARQGIFTQEFLLARPLLQALLAEQPVVLLVDEIDKSDDEFESFLLEILSDYQVTIPELGTIRAKHIPVAVLTSNSSREFGDALKRRCIYLYLGYPSFERELEIIRLKLPGITEALARQVVGFVQELRKEKLRKAPSISETIDWARALLGMNVDSVGEEILEDTLGILMKNKADIETVRAKKLSSLLP